MQSIENINITTCFLGTTGFLPEGVFSSQNTMETQLKRQAIKVSRRCVMLADASKYGISAFSVFARAGDVDILISDWRFQEAAKMAALGMEVMIADLDQPH
jgi:DeoR/GlpR family transcriptional regulator of sugar metabolism